MDRRTFLRSSVAVGLTVGSGVSQLWTRERPPVPGLFTPPPLPPDMPEESAKNPNPLFGQEEDIKDYLNRMRHFDEHFLTDTVLPADELPILASCVKKMRQVEAIVGYSRFTVIGFTDMLGIARNYSRVEAFSGTEVELLQRIFHTDALQYGFMDRKTIENLEHKIDSGALQRIEGTPHYLYQGKAVETFEKLKGEMGQDLILTSGVRGIVKQLLLFLGKANDNRGNLSLASRQLAPPGYSFHGVGDLDVGKAGYGAENFTERFMLTDVFRKLADRGYLSLRYPQDNFLGVRFEPWHIKVVESV